MHCCTIRAIWPVLLSFRTSSESTDTFTLDTWTGQPLLNLFVASVPVPTNVAALLRTMHPREGAGLPVGHPLIDDQRPIARLRVSGRVTPARERLVQALVRLRISPVARGSLPRR